MLKSNNPSKKNDISQLVNEVGSELGVDTNTRKVDGNPKNFAQKLKQAIQKRS